jgi:hypothetical protein
MLQIPNSLLIVVLLAISAISPKQAEHAMTLEFFLSNYESQMAQIFRTQFTFSINLLQISVFERSVSFFVKFSQSGAPKYLFI